MPKILVIDDEADLRRVVGMLLTQAGYEVIDAEYGLSGYSKALSEKPDLILLDLMMPVMDGFMVLEKLKQNPSAREIPVIILTAKIDAKSERDCLRLGATDYIKKPWGPRELEDRVGMALGYPELSKLIKPTTPDSALGGAEDQSVSLEAEVLPKSPLRPSPSGELPGEPGNSPVRERQKYTAEQFRLSVDDVDPVDADLVESGASDRDGTTVDRDQEGPDSSQPKKFRTRSFRVHSDGVDPASLL